MLGIASKVLVRSGVIVVMGVGVRVDCVAGSTGDVWVRRLQALSATKHAARTRKAPKAKSILLLSGVLMGIHF